MEQGGEGKIPIQVELKVGVMRSAGIESSVGRAWMSCMVSGNRAWISMLDDGGRGDENYCCWDGE